VRNRKPWVPPSEPVTGVGVTDRQSEKAEAEPQEDDVKHCVLLSCARYAAERLCN